MSRAVFILLIVAVCVCQAGDRLRISLPAIAASAPADVWVTIHLEPEEADRAMHYYVVGEPGESRSSVWKLEGENGWHIRQDETKHLPAGCYMWFAEVLDVDGRTRSVAHSPQMAVFGHDGNPCED